MISIGLDFEKARSYPTGGLRIVKGRGGGGSEKGRGERRHGKSKETYVTDQGRVHWSKTPFSFCQERERRERESKKENLGGEGRGGGGNGGKRMKKKGEKDGTLEWAAP